MISVSHLNKYYNKGKRNEIRVIDDTSLEFPSSGLITLFGPSGCGKTTLLNVIGGLDKASGTILYDNQNNIEKYRRENIGYIFQTYNLLNDYTVYENLALALSINDIDDEAEINKRIEIALKAVGMYKYRKKLASELSGGQQQRVAIARALVKKCKVIIADEPTGNLDSANSIQIMKILKELSKTRLVLLVTHSSELANYYSDKIIEIKDGKVMEVKDTTQGTSKLTGGNEVVLSELEKTKVTGDNLDVEVYGDCNDIKISLICVNNTYYLKSNVKIVPFNNQIKIVETKEEKEEETEEITYSDSTFDDTKRINIFKRFKISLKEVFAKRESVKRKKIFKVLFFMLGFILATLNFNLAKSRFIETNDILNAGDRVLLTNKENNYSASLVKSKYRAGLSDTFMPITKGKVSISKNEGSYITNSYEVSCLYTEGYDLVKGKLIYGEFSDYVMSKKLADELLKKSGLANYDSLFEKLNQNYYHSYYSKNQHQFSGIVDEDTDLVYEALPNKKNNKFLNNYGYIGVKYNDTNYINGQVYSVNNAKALEEAPLLYGTSTLNNGEVVVSKKFFDENLNLEEVFDKSSLYVNSTLSCKIVGVTNEDTYEIYVANSDYRYILEDGSFNLFQPKFNPKDSYSYYLLDNTNKLDSIKKEGYNSYTYSGYLYDIAKLESKASSSSYIKSIAICSIILIIYIFFIMRTQIIKDIYKIGVLRSLGEKKIRMYLNYTLEIIVTMFQTVFISFIIFTIIFGAVELKVASYSNSSFNLFTSASSYYTFFIMLLVTIVVGLLPLANLLRQTPAKILAKFDM